MVEAGNRSTNACHTSTNLLAMTAPERLGLGLMDESHTPAPSVPVRIVLASIGGLWLCYFVLITLRNMVTDDEYLLEMSQRRGVVMIAGIGITLLAWTIIRLFDKHRLGVRIGAALIIMLPAALALAMINQQVFASLERRMNERFANPTAVNVRHDSSGNVLIDIPDPPSMPRAQIESIQKKLDEQGLWRQLTDLAISRYFLLLAWAALYLALLNAAQARAAERREGEYRRAAKAAELQSLRYQINPHFLFNTLNSLSALVMTGKDKAAEEMIQTLATFYRRGLADDPTADHPLSEEIELQRLYLEIEALRFPERLLLSVDVSEQLGNVPVPGMILQPLVENAVKYGVSRSRKPVTITIATTAEFGRLVIAVSDNGPGADPGSHGLGIGLANVRDRLQARYGDLASLTAAPYPGGYRVELRLPMS